MADYEVIAIAESTPTQNIRQLSSIRERVLKNLGNDNDYFTDDDIDEYIVMAMNNVAEEIQTYESSETQNTVSGEYLYTVPDDTIKITHVIYNNRRLEKKEKKEILKMYDINLSPENATGIPQYWCRENLTQIRLYPTPSEENELVIHYLTYPEELANDTDQSVFIKRIDQIAEFYATAMLKLRDGEQNEGMNYFRLYQDAMNKICMLQIDQPQFIEREE